MFRAILHGKVRNNLIGVDLGSEWRSLYRETEDFLTAAVFCRLTYLPSDTVWAIIRRAAEVNEPHALPEDVGRLKACEFWPRWELESPEQDARRKEPDVFLEFERLSLLIEAKLGDGHQQSPRQWAAEVAARLQREEVDRSIPVWLLAMGGMGEEPSRTIVIPIREEAERLLHDTYRFPDVPVLLATCSWRHLLTALAETTKQIDTQSDTGIGYVIADLVEILRFHGIRYSHWLEELLRPQVLPLRTAHVESAVTLGEWVGPPKSAIRAERSPWFIAPDLRGIRDQAILTLGEIIYGH